eukprot:g6048.t1
MNTAVALMAATVATTRNLDGTIDIEEESGIGKIDVVDNIITISMAGVAVWAAIRHGRDIFEDGGDDDGGDGLAGGDDQVGLNGTAGLNITETGGALIDRVVEVVGGIDEVLFVLATIMLWIPVFFLVVDFIRWTLSLVPIRIHIWHSPPLHPWYRPSR